MLKPCNYILTIHRANSANRSATALAALLHLSMSWNDDVNRLPEFYCAVARVEPIFHLEKLVQDMDESCVEKSIFLSLAGIARAQVVLLSEYSTNPLASDSRYVQQLRERIVDILQSYW